MKDMAYPDEMYAVMWCSVIFETNPFKMTDDKFETFLEDNAGQPILNDLISYIAKNKDAILYKIKGDCTVRFADSEDRVREDQEKIVADKRERLHIEFPRIILTYNSQCDVEITPIINPCFGRAPNTKVIAVPMLKGKLSKDEISQFFKEMRDRLTGICNRICDVYFEILKEIISSSRYIKYEIESCEPKPSGMFHLNAYVIGSENESFATAVRFSKDRNLMEKTIEDSNVLQESLDVLKSVRIPENGKSYHWFTKELTKTDNREAKISEDFANEGLFAYLRSDKRPIANFIGLASRSPEKITRTLMLEALRSI